MVKMVKYQCSKMVDLLRDSNVWSMRELYKTMLVLICYAWENIYNFKFAREKVKIPIYDDYGSIC